MKSLARKVMDLAEQQGLLDGKAIAELRKQVAESKFVITPEAIAKVLVDHGHLTPFQARRLVSQAQGDQPDPVEQRVAEKPKPPQPKRVVEELTFADPADRPPEPESVEVVDLEVADLKSEPKQPKKPVSKPVAKPATAPEVSAREKNAKEKPAPIVQQVEGSTADDFVDLAPAKPTAPKPGNRWKSDPVELSETVELTPIDLASPAPLSSPMPDLAPIDDLFGPEPTPTPLTAPAGHRPRASAPLRPLDSGSLLSDPLTPLKPIAPARRGALKNVWDSPLMLIGGGALGVILVLFALLFYALTRGSAAELFTKAEEEYRAGAYSNALGIYEQFLKQYPDDPSAGLARVRRGMATLRQVTDDGKNPRLGLDTAKQVLPEIEKEEKFSEARGELATILPDIADGFATQAAQAADAGRKGELVQLAGDALTLVNNPAYLPASLRKDREGHILRIVDKLRAAERSIQQDKDLVTAVEKISAAAEKGNAAAGYQTQAELLRTYPGLATNPQLVAAVRQIGDKERQLVTNSTGGPEPMTTDHVAGSQRVLIPFREQSLPAAEKAQPVFVLVEGAVYSIDAVTGEILWRRFVGYETTNQPVALADGGVALIDGRRSELVCLKGSSGELAWRQKLNGPAFGPVPAGNRLVVTTRKGAILSFDARSGQITASAQLPQGAPIAPAIRQTRLYQLGEHSTLFVLDAGSLQCTETVYLGHRGGEILVPPVAVLDQLLVMRSPADDYSEIQVFSPDAKTRKVTSFGKPQRLKGRIASPLSVSGARVAVVTDLGQVAVFEVDSAGATDHLRKLAGLDASEATPRDVYCELDRNRLWVANHRAESFEVQSSLSQLARKWTQNHDDVFVAPLRLQGEMLVQVRRHNGVAGLLVEACRASVSGDAAWTVHLAAPIAALATSDARNTVACLTGEGRLFLLSEKQLAAGRAEASFSPPRSGAEILDEVSLSADGQTLVWTDASAGGRAFLYDVKSGSKPAAISLPAPPAASAISLGNDIVAPLNDGTVQLVSRDANAAKTAPFMPPLAPDALPEWTKPVALADGKTFLISDGRSAVYAVTKREGAKPLLAQVGEPTKTPAPVVSPLVLAGSVAIGVVRQTTSDALGGFDARGAAAFEPLPLEGRVQMGPFAVGGLVFVFAEPDGLVCFSSDGRVRWQQPAEQGMLAGPPIACERGDVLVAYQSGLVCRVDPATGNRLGEHDIGEPLSGPICIFSSYLFVAGSDGIVHRIAVPQRK